ncbi:cell division protein FtsW [Hypnocyclicus thermotrophus]|uniref:Cell division protein FtsW n=1 Tax=Hypnocyclicus thermotrophus TaxID=1627895 RepID=A0AA46DX33_9FUSO|nr:FtsW/RodA/SpoVE family cell cycle protein [Hypnocyclicus thermotrophus]TDT67436.1 cell division protein FtsW [Hypnocyclicus thermotrophus]
MDKKNQLSTSIPNYAIFIVIISIVILLSIFSVINIASSNLNNVLNEKSLIGFKLAFKQLIFLILSLGIVFLIVFIAPYKKLENSYIVFTIYLFTNILLIWVLFGREVNGAKRWLDIPLGFKIQPSEFAKITFIILLAKIFSKIEKYNKQISFIDLIEKKIINNFIIIFIIPALVLLEKDLGTVIHYSLIFLSMFLISKIKKGFKTFILIFYIGAILLGGVYIYKTSNHNDYKFRRINSYVERLFHNKYDKDDQVTQSIYGIASGGFLGRGYGNGIQKYNYVPEIHTDFIFATISEEMGFLISTIIIISYIVLYYFLLLISFRSKNMFGKYLVFGIANMIISQVILNLYVVTGLFPTTGIPLPFLSYGGSSTLTMYMIIALALNVLRTGNIKREGKNEFKRENN